MDFFFLRHSCQNNEISSPYNSHPKKAQTGSFMTHQMDMVNRKRNLSLQSIRDLEAIWNLITPPALAQTRITGSKLGRVWFLPSLQVMLIIILFFILLLWIISNDHCDHLFGFTSERSLGEEKRSYQSYLKENIFLFQMA